MKTIPICPHCNQQVKKIIESQTWTHNLERLKEVFHEWGKHPFTYEPDPNGELMFIATNEGKTFICGNCGGNVGDHFGVMGSYTWFERGDK